MFVTIPLPCPPELMELALPLMQRLERAQHPALPGHTFEIHDWTLSTAGRLYYSANDLRAAIASSQGSLRAWTLCLGTRHGDGYLREACVRQLIHLDQPWVMPFVVQLIGEYVAEIAQVVLNALPAVNAASYATFVRRNAGFVATTRRRATSYWSCYYRQQYSALRDYPGIMALDVIEEMARSSTSS